MSTERKEFEITSKFSRETNGFYVFRCHNQFGEEDAPGDSPSCVWFGKAGLISQAHWRRGGISSRKNGYPTGMFFDEVTGEFIGACWSDENGLRSRENGLPSEVFLFPETGLPLHLSFHLNGQYFRPDGKENYIDFDPDGIAYNEQGGVIQVDDSHTGWLDTIPQEALLDSKKFPFYNFS